MSCETITGVALDASGQTISFDPLSNAKFQLSFPSMPNLVMFLQEFTVPEVMVQEVKQLTRFADVNNIGEKIIYGNFVCDFLVDSNFKNYREIYDWMRQMTVAGSQVGREENPLLIVNGKDTFRFVGAWPTSLGNLNFKSNNDGVVYLTCRVNFNIDYFEFTDAPFALGNP